MSEAQQPQVLTTDGKTIRSSTAEPGGAQGSPTAAVTGAPQGTPAVEPQGYASMAQGPGEPATGYGTGSKVGVADPDDTRLAAAGGAAFGLAEGGTPAGGDAYAEPGARRASHPDDASRGTPEQPGRFEREGAAGAKGE